MKTSKSDEIAGACAANLAFLRYKTRICGFKRSSASSSRLAEQLMVNCRSSFRAKVCKAELRRPVGQTRDKRSEATVTRILALESRTNRGQGSGSLCGLERSRKPGRKNIRTQLANSLCRNQTKTKNNRGILQGILSFMMPRRPEPCSSKHHLGHFYIRQNFDTMRVIMSWLGQGALCILDPLVVHVVVILTTETGHGC